jgi:hypothetical protein
MSQQRRHFKQTQALEERCANEADRLRGAAKFSPRAHRGSEAQLTDQNEVEGAFVVVGRLISSRECLLRGIPVRNESSCVRLR